MLLRAKKSAGSTGFVALLFAALFAMGLLLVAVWAAPSASAQGSPEIEIENLVKLASSNIDYPANDYYSFNRIKDPGPPPVVIEDFRIAKTHDTNTMRISNPGTDPLIISAISITHTDTNPSSPGPSYELPNGEDQNLPLVIAPGGTYDLEMAFIAVNGSKRLIKDEITIQSNATNSPTTTATLHGIYMAIPREGNEIGLQGVFDVFGYQTQVSGPNLCLYCRDDIPTAADVQSGRQGDLVLADFWQQADVSQPVYGTMLAVFNGQTSSARFVDANGAGVGSPSMGMTSNRHWEQSIFPRNVEARSGAITQATSQTIVDANGARIPFRISSNGYSTAGFPVSNPQWLGIRMYRAIDSDGFEIPNTYLATQDFVTNGCQDGAANCDFQDTVMLFTNIEPINPVLSPYAAPTPGSNFDCDANAGVLTWTDAGESKYWVYKSTDGGATYNWLGRTAGAPAATTFTDPAPAPSALYQVHYAGIPRIDCSVSQEPAASVGPFACEYGPSGYVTWTNAGESKYWVYKSVDNGATFTWLGRTAGAPAPTSFTDPNPSAGALYQVHYQGLPRVNCANTGVVPPTGPAASDQFAQLGVDLDGAAAGEQFGFSVGLDADGDTVVVGAHKSNSAGANAGHVQVLTESNGTWTQVGSTIDGAAAGDELGRAVAINDAGTRIVIGAPKNDAGGADAGMVQVFELAAGSWVQVGADIIGEAAGDQAGFAVAMSADGNTVVVGAMSNDGAGSGAGSARVYELSAGSWAQVGADIDGAAAGDQAGFSVAISSDATTVAIGSPRNDASGTDSGHVRVFEASSGAWVQVGADIDGEAAADRFGYSVALNADGSDVIIGGRDNDDAGNRAGHARVLTFNGGSWTQVGADIDGEAAEDRSGYLVSMSADGQTVAIGAIFNDGAGNLAGQARAYALGGGVWAQIGTDIDGEAAEDRAGTGISLSDDGRTLAVGAPFNDGAGADAGHVRVYRAGSSNGGNNNGGGATPFACSSVTASGVLTWTDAAEAKYWVYKSTDGGATYVWIGRTAGAPAAATFTDPSPTAGALYQVHYQGIPRADCTAS